MTVPLFAVICWLSLVAATVLGLCLLLLLSGCGEPSTPSPTLADYCGEPGLFVDAEQKLQICQDNGEWMKTPRFRDIPGADLELQ